jgi:hypothetical protein
MKASVYIRAARKLDLNTGCCFAITKAAWLLERDDFREYEHAFTKVFKPYNARDWWWYGNTVEKNLLPRQLALLLMAEMIKEGDL